MSKNQKAIDTNRKVTLTEAGTVLRSLMAARLPVFMWGTMGIGKSDIAKQVAKEMGGISIDLRMANYQPTDISGIPFFNKNGNDGAGTMSFAQPSKLPSAALAAKYPVVILFLDELNSAPPATQAAAYQLVLDRKVEEYTLPDNVLIIAAGNKETDRGVTYRMPAPLANRFVHIELTHDWKAWFDWASTIGHVHPDVLSYITYAKSHLHTFDTASTEKAFASPRAWSYVSKILFEAEKDNGMSEPHLPVMIAGTVGENITPGFMAFRKIGKDLPSPADILSGKATKLTNKDVSAQYSLITNLCFELKDFWIKHTTGQEQTRMSEKVKRDWKTSKFESQFHDMSNYFIRFMMANFDTEITIMGARLAMKNFQLPFSPGKIPDFKPFVAKYGSMISDNND